MDEICYHHLESDASVSPSDPLSIFFFNPASQTDLLSSKLLEVLHESADIGFPV